MSNPICYISGSFKNIYGGTSPAPAGFIMHLTALPKQSLAKWPYLKNMYQIDDGANLHRYAKTWKEAAKIAKELWPNGVPTIHHEEFKKDFPTAVFEYLSDVDFSKGFC